VSALALNLRATWGRAYGRLAGALREPVWLATEAILPNVGMVAFVMLYRALGAPRSFEALAVLGGLLSTYWINVLWGMGSQFYWEKQSGQLQLYFAAPCSRMAILSGMALGGFLLTTLRSVFGLFVGFVIVGARVGPFSVPALLGVFFLTMLVLYALGMIMASLFLLWGREAWQISNALHEPVQFLSGLFFPLRALGPVGFLAAGLVPIGLAVDALRQVLLGAGAHGLVPLRFEVAGLVALGVLLLWLAQVALAHLESLAKREGRLTQRWQ
jgi:ABC-2 type transport system permease protein